MVVGVALQVGRANAGVTHDGRGRSRLIRRGRCTVAAVVLGVVATVLVPHFVGHVVHVEWVAHGRTASGHSAGLASATRGLQVRHTTAARRKHVTDVVVRRTNDAVARVDVLGQHGSTTVVGVGVCASIEEDDLVVVGHNLHGQAHIPLKDSVDTRHGGVHGGKHTAHGSSVELRVLPCARERESVCAELRSVVHAVGRHGRTPHGLDLFATTGKGIGRRGL